jgi:hypothetical protein
MRQLDRLDHHERLRELTAHLRELSDVEAQELAHALGRGDTYRRWIALHVAAVRHEASAPLAALHDPSVMVRRKAARLAGRLAESLPADLPDRVDASVLDQLSIELVRRRASWLAQALCEDLCARQRLGEATRLLRACPSEWIAERLDRFAWPDGVWLRLAKHRPELLCDRIERQFGEAERAAQVFARYAYEVWAQLCKGRPQVVAAWIDRHVPRDEFPDPLVWGFASLCVAVPERVVDWLATRPSWLPRVGLGRGLVKRLRKLDDELLAPLCRKLAQSQPVSLGEILSRLPFARRARLFAQATAELETAHVEWPLTLLAVLPRTLADREATRMLGLQRAAIDGSWRRQLLGYRAIAAARPLLEAESQSAQAEERGEALAAMVAASARAATGMGETLAYLRRIRNEQDPVRLAVLAALASVPGQRFGDAAALDLVIAPIFDARDTSWATRQQAARVAQNLLIAHASKPKSPLFALGVSLLERLAGQHGTPDLPRLDRNLPRGAEQTIVDALLPWVRAAQSRQQDQHAFRLWSALGKRAWLVPELSSLIADIIWQGQRNIAGHAASLWVQDPSSRDVRVRELVRKDKSALYLPSVFAHCLRRRQTLLLERFAGTPPRGRFHDGKVVMVPPVEGGFHCWPSDLQRKYTDLIRSAEAEPKQFTVTRARLVAIRARVPVTTVADLTDALASSDVGVQEAALGALAWMDSPEPALPILLEQLESDRARVAMYAIPRLAGLLPRPRLVKALGELLARPLKVTVHKEAVRLLGILATPPAIELLRDIWTQVLHRDVRIAALHAARSTLWTPESWAILASAANDESPDIARALLEVPIATVAEVYRPAYLRLMLRTADHPNPIVRTALFTALEQRWSWVDPPAVVHVAARVVERLDPVDPWGTAARIVASGASSQAAHTSIERVCEALVAAADRGLAPAGEQDRPAHRRLAALLDAMERERHPVSLRLLDGLAGQLLAKDDWWSAGVRLRLAATASEQIGERVLELIARVPSPRSLVAIELAVRGVAGLAARDWAREQAEQVVGELVNGSVAARIVGLAMLEPFGRRWGWGTPWVGMLSRLRADTDLDVRTTARALWIDGDREGAVAPATKTARH